MVGAAGSVDAGRVPADVGSVVDARGQCLSVRDRLYLVEPVPMLLVWGDRDPVLPVAHARAIADELPGCGIEVVPGAGHMPHLSHPDRFVDLVDRFLDRCPPARVEQAAWRDLLVAASGAADDRGAPPIVAHSVLAG